MWARSPQQDAAENELLAHLVAQWPLARVLIQGTRALYPADAHPHRRERQRLARAIIVDDATTANRAIYIPEFVNLPPGATIDKIDPQATDFYRLFDEAYAQIQTDQFPQTIATLRTAIAANPDDSLSLCTRYRS